MRPGTGFAHGRAFALMLLAAAAASAVACALAVAACITAPPPDLPQLPPQRPTVLHDAVIPPEGLLYDWPSDNTFTVPVQVDVQSPAFYYNVFVDYSAVTQQALQEFSGMGPGLVDGGVTLVSFPLSPPDTPTCPHTIDFLVANGFNPSISSFTPEAVGNAGGGDIVTWSYFPNGSQGGCPAYDAGDGVFPDVLVDGLLVTPESGGDP
ncbi:MAG: hypothetical protein ACLP1X_18470 [Polyangiaceae bacterium]|jgi:hypothetical protein